MATRDAPPNVLRRWWICALRIVGRHRVNAGVGGADVKARARDWAAWAAQGGDLTRLPEYRKFLQVEANREALQEAFDEATAEETSDQQIHAEREMS